MLWLRQRLGRRYVRVVLALQFQLAFLVVAAGVGLLSLFGQSDAHDLVTLLGVACGLVAIENVVAFRYVSSLLRPADPWLRGEKGPVNAVRAWRALSGLPLDFVRGRPLVAALFNVVPISAFATWLLDLPVLPSFFVLCAGSGVVLLYGVLLRYFAMEIITRPVLEELSGEVPPEVDLGRTTLNLKARLLLALPAINIISGVVVSGLSGGRGTGIDALGFGVGAAIVVAFTISLELSLLLGESILGPLRDLRDGTRRVAAGDLSTRVPVVSSDEIGRLAVSFNSMVAGLEERERLRDAFGAYLDPELVERIAHDGPLIAGEEVEVTVMFLDIRDFTAFAERASAREVVGLLNGFFDEIVPIISRHGGHANKFVGDGLLAVFGAPRKLTDHADRAVACALELGSRRWEGSLQIGIGLNSGTVVAGTVGGGGRVEFSVIGDAVNTAARVEEVTRVTGDVVLVTEATRALLREDHGGFVERPLTALKGKREPVRLFAALRTAAADGPVAEAIVELDSGNV